MKSKPKMKFFLYFSVCFVCGIIGGAGIGFLLGDIARGIAFGIAFGVLLAATLSIRKTGKMGPS
jgi:F0F1-type ATP synthase assembly protein I